MMNKIPREKNLAMKGSLNNGNHVKYNAFNLKFITMILSAFIFILLITTFISAYSRSAPAYTFGHQTTSFFGGQVPIYDQQLCGAGQDFILQVDPLGCTPSVVRSDLLEEQPVSALCPIYATQLNPLIKVENINHITISSRDRPQEVLTVGYYPARAALGKFSDEITRPVFDNIGYANIVLRRQPNESAMPDFVQGNLTANIRYNIHNAFGTGRVVYYLPQLTDEEFNRDFTAYGFWDGRGYLRLEGSDEDGATIGVYSDRDFSRAGRTGEKTRIATLNLEKGKSQKVSMPGFNYCLGGVNVNLVGLEDPNPDGRARIRVDSDLLEIQKGDKFLENACTVGDIAKWGLTLRAGISCREDDGKRTSFQLSVSPKIKLMFNGEEHEYGIGDRLPFSNDPNKFVYLGFIGTRNATNEEEGLYVRFVQSPQYNEEKLTDNMLSEVARFDNDDDTPRTGSYARRVAGWVGGRIADVGQWLERFSRYLVQGTEIGGTLELNEKDGVYGTEVTLLGFAGPQNSEISGSTSVEVKANYEKAMDDYETIREDFAPDVWPETDSETLGEKATSLAIILSDNLGQRKTASELCQEFAENYDSVSPNICNSKYLFANTAVSGQGVVVNGKTHILSFEGIRKPSREEYGAQITINNAGECSGQSTLGREEENCLSDSESIKLERVTDEFAEFDVSSVQESAGKELFWKTNNLRLKPGEFQVIGKNSYRISLDKINLQKVARVSLDPEVDYARTNATFNFKIGIEKRGIQLSPEKTTEKIQALNSTIQKLEKISDTLGKVVSAGKKACAVTSLALTAKNFLSNLGGKGIARQTVMRGENGWYDRCREEVNSPGSPYKDIGACLLDNSDEIEASVNAVNSVLDAQNEKMEQLQEGISKTSFLGETVVNTDALTARLVGDSEFKSEISSCASGSIIVAGETINKADVASNINPERVSLTQIRDLQLYCRLLNSDDPVATDLAQKQVDKIFGEIYSNTQADAVKTTFETEMQGQINNPQADTYTGKDQIGGIYRGATAKAGNNFGIAANTPVQLITFRNQKYLLELDGVSSQGYRIKNVYDESGTKLDNTKEPALEITRLFSGFKIYDTTSYKNPYADPIARYYETDPYRGLPAVVPFDLKDGWYAAIKSTLPIFGGLRAFDDSGRVSSFYVCNVGPDKQENFIGGDDICRGFQPGTGQSPKFTGLSDRDSELLMERATKAIQDASRQHSTGVKQITINSQPINVGSPAADIPDIQCEDFMSPTDCNIMFNVCDPFICPSSRCDLGGNYPVKDVVQSGVIGSLALCAPNFPEVKIPICVSGVHAGVEGWTSVFRSYERCLQTGLETGQTVGICDEINSVYMCEFVWRQGLPLAKYAAPKIISGLLGQNTRGGGEYLTTQNALDNVGKSFDFFTQFYADDSFRAFKARSTEQVGTELCRNYVSFAGPEGGNLLDAFAAPDSPTQFYGRFEEIQVQTITSPPSSHYKVFYHIYAGKDFPAYFQVYLRGTPGSFFQDTDISRPVASDFIPAGDFKTETLDFTAPSGYKELCIVVNGQEECGFKEVTTEFFINSITEEYVARQASQTNVDSEAECVSGSPDTFSFLNPNVQAGAEEFLNPAIYNRGIIRVCSTNNPGQGTDAKATTESARWKPVGNCGSENLICWLDANSVKDVIRNSATEERVLDEVADNFFEALEKDGNYINTTEFESLTKEILELQGPGGNDLEIIRKINEKIDKVIYNNQKGYLHLFRGISFGNLAQAAYNGFLDAQKQEGGSESEQPAEEEQAANRTQTALTCEDCGKGLFNLCDAAECRELSRQSGKACFFEDGFINSCKEDTGTRIVSLTCTDRQSCQRVLGNEIIKLAAAKKESATRTQSISVDAFDARVKTDTEAKSFECLILQLAFVESGIQQCKDVQSGESPLYCEGNPEQVISNLEGEGSFGIMQINTAFRRANGAMTGHCGSYGLSSDLEDCREQLSDFETNVLVGVEHLISGYDAQARVYRCHPQADGGFVPISYSGWENALRNYNGWNTDCTKGNPSYVEEVVAAKGVFNANFFPQCA